MLNRCVGIGENIKVKMKGAEKTPGTTTCVSLFVLESRGRGDLFAYTGVSVCLWARVWVSFSVCCGCDGVA